MQILKHILVFACVLGIVSGPVSAAGTSTSQIAQATQNATVSGTAYDNTGKALNGVTVTLNGPNVHKTVVTDSTGKYSFGNVPPGIYALSAVRPGFETAVQQDLAVSGVDLGNLNVSLVPSTLQSLRTIGSVSTTAGRSTFNVSALSVTTLDASRIDARLLPNLSAQVGELPGVVNDQDATSRSINQSWSVRGSNVETKVVLDGHSISTGVFGTYFNQFANSEIFQQVEVLKGAGINGVNAGESAFGTVNLRTRNITGKNNAELSLATDGYGSGHYFFSVEHNFLNDKLSVLAARSYQAYLGPDNNLTGLVGNTLGGTTFNGYNNNGGPSLIQWGSSLAHPFVTKADLVKARYKFSNATWLTGEFLNITGNLTNQGGSYAFYDGKYTVPQCANVAGKTVTFVPAGGVGCGLTSVYNSPVYGGLIGSVQTLYNYFPNSFILDNEPSYNLELRTTFKNDSIFLRPYRGQIKRFVNGDHEDTTPGYGGGWAPVTSASSCQLIYTPATATTGASGPCFTSANNYTIPYVGASTQQSIFPVLAGAPTSGCPVTVTATGPQYSCWTTPTTTQRNGVYSFNTPFSQPEVDNISGLTFSWVHPVNDNLYTFNVDYNRDNTLKFTLDNSPLPSGCKPVVIGGNANTPTFKGATNPYYQPACTDPQGLVLPTLPATALQIPPTTNQRFDYSLTALWQLNPRLQFGLGNYLSVQRLDAVQVDPAQVGAAAAFGLSGAEQADANLQHVVINRSHYDPHFQLEYRASRNLSLRATAGSAVTFPYAGITSGFPSLFPNTTPTSDSESVKAPYLQPEVTVAYDAGFDARLRDGSVISGDAFNNTIHNVWVTSSTVGPPLPGRAGAGILFTTINTTGNGALERDYGIELTAQKQPPVGWGYYVTATAQRAYFDGFSNAYYANLLANGNTNYIDIVNGKQLDGVGGFTGEIPYFKAKGEVNYAFPNHRTYAAFGMVHNGNNNPVAPAFQTFYFNASHALGNGLSIGLAGENIFDYSSGNSNVFTGNVINNAGNIITGVKWAPGCSCLINGAAKSFPFSYIVTQPANFRLSLTKKI